MPVLLVTLSRMTRRVRTESLLSRAASRSAASLHTICMLVHARHLYSVRRCVRHAHALVEEVPVGDCIPG